MVSRWHDLCIGIPSKAQFVAKEQCNIMQHCAVYKKYTLLVSAILKVRLLVLGIYQAQSFHLMASRATNVTYTHMFVAKDIITPLKVGDYYLAHKGPDILSGTKDLT